MGKKEEEGERKDKGRQNTKRRGEDVGVTAVMRRGNLRVIEKERQRENITMA